MGLNRTLSVERSTSTAHRLTHYDGVCGNIHGHNFKWELEVEVSMAGSGDGNMPLDLKEIAEKIDAVDHAILLNKHDPLLVNLREDDEAFASDALGEVYTFDGDPTCEVVAEWMAERICSLEPVTSVEVSLNETEKYGVETEVDHTEL